MGSPLTAAAGPSMSVIVGHRVLEWQYNLQGITGFESFHVVRFNFCPSFKVGSVELP